MLDNKILLDKIQVSYSPEGMTISFTNFTGNICITEKKEPENVMDAVVDKKTVSVQTTSAILDFDTTPFKPNTVERAVQSPDLLNSSTGSETDDSSENETEDQASNDEDATSIQNDSDDDDVSDLPPMPKTKKAQVIFDDEE